MVSKSQIKLITSLAQKKYRNQHGLFVVEGLKGITEFLKAPVQLHSLYAREGFFEAEEKRTLVTEKDLKKISFLTTPQKALAVFYKPEEAALVKPGLTLVLDDVRDPGNLGTIIRLCDWYGINNLVCSHQTVDCFNPKVVQATMGSLTRVKITYRDLSAFLNAEKRPVYGAFMDGKNVYKSELPTEAILVLGNEANGISATVESFIQSRICIPQFGTSATESLNVAVAASILVSESKRNSTAT